MRKGNVLWRAGTNALLSERMRCLKMAGRHWRTGGRGRRAPVSDFRRELKLPLLPTRTQDSQISSLEGDHGASCEVSSSWHPAWTGRAERRCRQPHLHTIEGKRPSRTEGGGGAVGWTVTGQLSRLHESHRSPEHPSFVLPPGSLRSYRPVSHPIQNKPWYVCIGTALCISPSSDLGIASLVHPYSSLI